MLKVIYFTLFILFKPLKTLENCHHFITFRLFQTMSFFHLFNTKEDIVEIKSLFLLFFCAQKVFSSFDKLKIEPL